MTTFINPYKNTLRILGDNDEMLVPLYKKRQKEWILRQSNVIQENLIQGRTRHRHHQLVEDVKRQDGVNQDVDALASQYTNVPRSRLCIGHLVNVAV